MAAIFRKTPDLTIEAILKTMVDGQVVETPFDCHFRNPTRSERDAWRQHYEEQRKLPEDQRTGIHIDYADYLIGWSGIQDEDGEKFQFSEENRALLLEDIDWWSAIDEAFVQVINRSYLRKNSEPPSAGSIPETAE